MRCANCDRENPEDARFCSGCGQQLPEKQVEKQPDASHLTALEAARCLAAATAASELGHSLEAEDLCKEAIQLDPWNAGARQLHARLLERRGDLDSALVEARELERLGPAQPGQRQWIRQLKQHAAPSALRRMPAAFLIVGAALVGGWAMVIATSQRPTAQQSSVNVIQAADAPTGVPLPVTTFSPGPAASYAPPTPAVGSSDSSAITSSGISSTAATRSSAPRGAPRVGASRTGGVGNLRPLHYPDQYASPESIELPPAVGPRRYGSSHLQSSGSAGRSSVFNGPLPPQLPLPGGPVPANDSGTVRLQGSTSERPADFRQIMNRAQTLRDEGDYGKAVAQYRRALQSAPDVISSARVHQQMGMTYSSMGAPREAISQFREAEAQYSSLLTGPDADLAGQALVNVRHQREMLERTP